MSNSAVDFCRAVRAMPPIKNVFSFGFYEAAAMKFNLHMLALPKSRCIRSQQH